MLNVTSVNIFWKITVTNRNKYYDYASVFNDINTSNNETLLLYTLLIVINYNLLSPLLVRLIIIINVELVSYSTILLITINSSNNNNSNNLIRNMN